MCILKLTTKFDYKLGYIANDYNSTQYNFIGCKFCQNPLLNYIFLKLYMLEKSTKQYFSIFKN